MADQGFDVHGIDFEECEIEVKGLDACGHCLEICFSPGSGGEMKRERNADCAPFGRMTPGSDDKRCDLGEDRRKD